MEEGRARPRRRRYADVTLPYAGISGKWHLSEMELRGELQSAATIRKKSSSLAATVAAWTTTWEAPPRASTICAR